MNVSPGKLEGLCIIALSIHQDQRGAFRETWRADRYMDAGIPALVQDNLVVSKRGVLRGMHFQNPHGQAKLVWVAAGTILDVAVDIRVGSPTFGEWAAYTLSGDEGVQLFVPEGFAHGYVTLSDVAIVIYKCSAYYKAECDGAIRWDDPDVAIAWPVEMPVLSERDRSSPFLRDVPLDRLPKYGRAG